MSSILKIGVYFGSFDPIHINHINLCKNLIDKGFAHIYLIPNQNSSLKPYMVSHQHRLEMIRKSIRENHLDEYLYAHESIIAQHSWEGRSQVCQSIKEKYEQCSIYQIIGQDSYEKALTRCHKDSGIYALNDHHLIVFPREKCSPKIPIPLELRHLVEVVTSYKDVIFCSSTEIRNKILHGCDFFELKDYLSHNIYSYIIDNHLYQRMVNNKKIIVVLGPPGGGKGTLCLHLAKMYPKYKHISTGDLYRQDQLNQTKEYQVLVEAKEESYQKYMNALNLYIINKLRQIISPTGYYLIDGLKPTDLRDFEEKIEPIDLIIILNCKYETAFLRLKKRQKEENRADDTLDSIKKRINNYYHYLWIQKEIIKSYQGTGREAININCEKPIHILVKIPVWNNLLK